MVAGRAQVTRRDLLRAVGATAGGAVLLSACGGGGSAAGEKDASGRFTGEIAVAHLETAMTASPFLVADDLGYFEAENLAPTMTSYPGGTDTIRAIATGTPWGMPATLPALIAYQKGQKNLRLISGAYGSASVNFLVPANSPIQSIDDLQGKKVAVSQPGSITTYFATRIATQQGLVPGQTIEILSVGGAPEAWTAAKQGVVDVAWSTPPISEQLIASGEARLLFETSDYVPGWADTTFWARQDFIDENPEVLRSFLRVMDRAFTVMKNQPDVAAAAYARRANLDGQVALAVVQKAAPALNLAISMAGIEENVRAGVELGQLEPSIDLDQVILADFAKPS